MLNELKTYEKNIGSYKDMKERLQERENCFLRLGYKGESSIYRSKKIIDEERKTQMVDNMTTKFGNVTVGIHG